MKKKFVTIEDLKNEGLVKNASELVPAEGLINKFKVISHNEYMEMELLRCSAKEKWTKEIEDYCQNAGILPKDLINLHRDSLKGKKVAKNDKKGGLPSDKPSKSEWRKDFIHKKTGI